MRITRVGVMSVSMCKYARPTNISMIKNFNLYSYISGDDIEDDNDYDGSTMVSGTPIQPTVSPILSSTCATVPARCLTGLAVMPIALRSSGGGVLPHRVGHKGPAPKHLSARPSLPPSILPSSFHPPFLPSFFPFPPSSPSPPPSSTLRICLGRTPGCPNYFLANWA